MIDFGAGVWLDAFVTEDLPGSPQCVHLFPNVEARAHYRLGHSITDGFDHTYAVLTPGAVHVEWANSAGNIQLCGAGAAALTHLLLNVADHRVARLEAPGHSLHLATADGTARVTMHAQATMPLDKHSHRVTHTSPGKGVFLVELDSRDALTVTDLSEQQHGDLADCDVHSLCCYHWDHANQQGSLRYFVPRYGRAEDHVTGSVHAYLAPIIKAKYGASRQRWRQLSASPGEVIVESGANHVSVQGQCRLQAGIRAQAVKQVLTELLQSRSANYPG